ncbi:MAG: glycosyltransferase family 2 protein [Chloroflexia bacterium]
MILVFWASLLFLVIVAVHLAHLYLLAVGVFARRRTMPGGGHDHRFAILIPAHNEELVIGHTLEELQRLKYPRHLYNVYVVADHCTDRTADRAREAGTICFERQEGLRGSKAAALSWLFGQVRATAIPYDAYVILDADTWVDDEFLRYMDAALAAGHHVIQGQHRIRNPHDGPYPALAAVMMILDNLFQNQGRSNLGGSAKLMGDSVCFRAETLERFAWAGDSLTEDYELRFRLLLEGVRIHYLPEAIGYGEAPVSWTTARRQRARWLVGTRQARRRYAGPLLRAFLRRPSFALFDGFLQTVLLPYSMMVLFTGLVWAVNIVLAFTTDLGLALAVAWSAALLLLAPYPVLGLICARAPRWAYRALAFGPFFILWRAGMDLLVRLGLKKTTWVRTPRRGEAKR